MYFCQGGVPHKFNFHDDFYCCGEVHCGVLSLFKVKLILENTLSIKYRYLIHIWIFSTLGFQYPELCSLTTLASKSDYSSTFSLSSSSRFSSTFSSSLSRALSGVRGGQVKNKNDFLQSCIFHSVMCFR